MAARLSEWVWEIEAVFQIIHLTAKPAARFVVFITEAGSRLLPFAVTDLSLCIINPRGSCGQITKVV